MRAPGVPGMQPRPGSSSWIVWLIVGAVVAALVVGGLVAWAIVSAQNKRREAMRERFRMYEREDAERRAVEREAGRGDVPNPDPPVARLGKPIAGQNSVSRFWLIPYTNEGTSPIARPQVMVRTYSDLDELMAEETGFAQIDRLDPGKTAIVLVLAQSEMKFSRFEVSPAEPKIASWEKIQAATVTEWREEKPDIGLSKIAGMAKNEWTGTLSFVIVEALGRNAAGEVVAYSNGYLNDSDLDPGESSGFALTLGVWEAEPPVRWELVAHGRP
jgi:hypothetical protein